MIYHVLGCGSGSMGEAIAAGLIKEDDSIVFLSDQNPEHELATAKKLEFFPTGNRSALLRLNISGEGLDILKSRNDLPRIFQGADVVISALPVFLNPLIADAVIRANETRENRKNGKTHYCDLGGALNVTKEILSSATQERAKKYQISLVTSAGFQPDIGGIVAKYMLENCFDLDRAPYAADSIIIYACGLPACATPPYYKKLFNLEGLREIYYNWPLVIVNGKARKIKPLSHYEILYPHHLWLSQTRPGTEFEAAVTSGLDALPYYFAGYVKTLQEKTIRYKGHYEFVKKNPREKFIEAFQEILANHPIPENDISILKVMVKGKEKDTNRQITAEFVMHAHSDKNFNSMQKATGFTVAEAAKMMADGKAKIGALPASIALPTGEFISWLKNEFKVFESITYPLTPLP